MSYNSNISSGSPPPENFKNKVQPTSQHRYEPMKTNSSVEFTSGKSRTFNLQNTHETQRSFLSSIPDDARDFYYPSPLPIFQAEKTPPDIDLAIRHNVAHRVAPLTNLINSTDFCESTGVPLTKAKIPLFCGIEELYHLGPTYPMYFLMIKQMSYFLGALSLIVGILFFQQFFEGSISGFFYEEFISNIYRSQTQTLIFVLYPFGLMLIMFLVFYKFRSEQKKIKMSCKRGNISSSAYTVKSSNFGNALTEQIKTFFSNCIVQDYSLDVVRITKSFDVGLYIEKIRELVDLLEIKNSNKVEERKSKESFSSGFSFQSKIDKKIEAINLFFNKRKVFLSKFQIIRKNEVCFITFNTRREAKIARRRFEFSKTQRLFLRVFGSSDNELSEYFFNKNFLKVEKAPEPSEIIWENLCNPSQGFSIYFIQLCLWFGIFSLTGLGIYKLCQLDIPYKGYLKGVIVALTNELFYLIVSILTSWEKCETITEKQITLASKITFLQLFNMFVPIFLVEIVILQKFPNIMDLSNDLLFLGIISLAFPLLYHTLFPQYILKSLRRIFIGIQGSKCSLTQEQANQVYENPELNISYLYSNIIKTFLFACLIFHISPGIVIISFIALCLGYWIDKYNLLRKSLLPSYIRSELPETMFDCLEFGFFLLSLGNILYYCSLIQNSKEKMGDLSIVLIISILEVVLSLLYLILPNKKISRSLFPIKKPEEGWSSKLLYQQAADYFPTDYHFCNPVIRLNVPSVFIQEKYKDVFSYFNCIDILHECPEILPIFAYSKKFPSFYKVWKYGYKGLKNPYYIFPHNYGYSLGQLERSETSKDSKDPLLQSNQLPTPKFKRIVLKDLSGIDSKTVPMIQSNQCQSNLTVSKNQDTKDLMSMIKEMSHLMRENKNIQNQTKSQIDKGAENTNQYSRVMQKQKNTNQDNLSESLIEGDNFLLDMESFIVGVSPLVTNSLDQTNIKK